MGLFFIFTGILQKIVDQQVLTESISVSSLGRLLKNIGFKYVLHLGNHVHQNNFIFCRWQKTPDKRKFLCESYDIRLKQINFLKKLVQYRSEGRNIVYTDETYIHSSHIHNKGWYDESLKGLQKPISKGQRLIIVHAGGEKGFIENGLLIFKSGNIYVHLKPT